MLCACTWLKQRQWRCHLPTLLYITLSVSAGWCCCYWCWLQLRTFHCAFTCICSSKCRVGAAAAAVIVGAVVIIIIIDFNVEGILCPRKCYQNIHTLDDDAHLAALCQKSICIRRSTSQSICIRFRLVQHSVHRAALHANRLISLKITAINCNKVYRRNYSVMVMSRLGNILFTCFICLQFHLAAAAAAAPFFSTFSPPVKREMKIVHALWKWVFEVTFSISRRNSPSLFLFGHNSFYFRFVHMCVELVFAFPFFSSPDKKQPTLSHAKFQV